MNFEEFYSKIKNPIEDHNVIKNLLLAYSKTFHPDFFYNQLIKLSGRNNAEEINEEDSIEFYVNCFNEIKRNITGLTKEKFEQIAKDGHGRPLLKLRKQLLTIPDVKSIDEINAIYDNLKNTDLKDSYAYYFSGVYPSGSWQHISLRNMSAKMEKYDKVEHRLYLNIAKQDTYKMASILRQKMKEHNLPYYFKFAIKADRDDTIVIYSSSKYLMEHIELLKEIEKEYPNIISRAERPSLLTGMVNDWIGYGSEPIYNDPEIRESYNSKRAHFLPNVIRDELKKWLSNNRYTKYFNGEKEITFEEFLADYCSDKLIERMQSNYKKFKKTEEQFEKDYGYGAKELGSPRIKAILKGIFKNNIRKLVNAYIYDKNDEIKINVKNNHSLVFNSLDFRYAFKEMIPHIIRISPSILEDVSVAIKRESVKHGIDSNNFSFDNINKNLLKEAMDKEQKRIKTPPLIKPSTKKIEIKKETNKDLKNDSSENLPTNSPSKKENPIKIEVQSSIIEQLKNASTAKKEKNEQPKEVKTFTDEELERTDVSMITKVINQELLNKPMKLPNRTTISAKEYIEKIVFQHIPENGIVILDNGNAIPALQFIEEGVMFECQEKYNGNFPLYLQERTRANCGVLKLKKAGNDFDLDPQEIPNYVNQTLLIRPIKLPNDKTMPTPEFISRFYSQHIPHNGNITLPNGNKLSVKRYIEDILLYALESKYNGNLPLALYETTRKNTGTVDLNKNNFEKNLQQMQPITVNERRYK